MGNKTEIKRSRIMTIAMFLVTFAILGQIISLVGIVKDDFAFIDKVMMCIDVIFCSIGLIVAEVYVFSGFTKKAAKFFKIFLFTFLMSVLISSLIVINGMLNGQTKSINLIFHLVVLIALFVLLFVKDLGKKLSLSLSYFTLIANIGLFVYSMLTNSNIDYLIKVIGTITLSIVLVVMQHMKYIDKAQRYAKVAN